MRRGVIYKAAGKLKSQVHRTLGLSLVLVALAVVSCQIPLLLVVSNTSDQPLELALHVGAAATDHCEGPTRSAYMPVAHVSRWFREPHREPAADLVFERASCLLRATIPASKALELEFSPLAGYQLFEPSSGVDLVLKGSLGTVSFSGPQVERHLTERRGALVYTYGNH